MHKDIAQGLDQIKGTLLSSFAVNRARSFFPIDCIKIQRKGFTETQSESVEEVEESEVTVTQDRGGVDSGQDPLYFMDLEGFHGPGVGLAGSLEVLYGDVGGARDVGRCEEADIHFDG